MRPLKFEAGKHCLTVEKKLANDEFLEDKNWRIFVRGNGYHVKSAKWITAESILKACLSDKLSMTDIDGSFLIILQELRTREVTIITDHLNFFPCYWDEERLIISDSLTGFRQYPMDTLGLGELVGLGHLLGNRTLFQGVKKLPAASFIRFKPKQEVSMSTYWKCEVKKTSEEEFKQLFSRTISRIPHLSVRPSLTMTAGLDSRMVLSELLKENISTDLFTFGDPRSADMITSATIAKSFGLAHRPYPVSANEKGFMDAAVEVLDENEALADGMINTVKAVHTNYCISKEAALHDMIITATGELVYSHFAEVPTIIKKDNTSVQAIADFLIDFNLDKNILPSSLTNQIKADLTNVFARYSFEDKLQYYDAFYLEKLSSLTAYLQQIISLNTRVFNPIFTKEMIAASLGLPPKSRRKRNFQRRLIVENKSELNKYLVNGFKLVLPTPVNLVRARFNYGVRLFKKAANKILKKNFFLLNYLDYSAILKNNKTLTKALTVDTHQRLGDFKTNYLKKSNLNFLSLNRWMHKDSEAA